MGGRVTRDLRELAAYRGLEKGPTGDKNDLAGTIVFRFDSCRGGGIVLHRMHVE